MARRDGYPGGKWYRRPGQAYARTSGWPTRYYQRKTGGTIVSSLAGLNTTSDDFEKREGESPYMWNARLDGTKEQRKRAQSMSRMGQEFYCMPEGSTKKVPAPIGDERIELNETTSIKWELEVKDRLLQVGLRFAFNEEPDYTNAHFVLILRDENSNEVCRAIKKVTEIYDQGDKEIWFRFIKSPKPSSKVILEATVIDDFDNDGKPTDFVMYIKSIGCDNHLYSYHNLPNLDNALREEPYTWNKGISIPATSYETTDWKTFPVWLQKGYFNASGSRYSVIGAINSDGAKCVYAVKYTDIDENTGEHHNVESKDAKPFLLIPSNKINQSANQIRMTQAGNELFFVDGYSPLQEVVLDDFSIKNAKPDMSEVDTFEFTPNMYYYANAIVVAAGQFQRCKQDFQAGDTFDQNDWEPRGDGTELTAWDGASLIYFHNNRLFLSGFRHATVGVGEPKAEPNLVIMSSIDSVKPQYHMFNRSVEFFYVPDMSPSRSSAAPVTAFSQIGDYLAIFTSDGLYLEQVQSAVEFSGISQTTPEGAQYGVMKQEHVVEGPNNIWFYNPSMGICRTAGSTVNIMSSQVDSVLCGLSEASKANSHLCMTNDILRFFYSPDDEPNDEALIDYTGIPQHKSYWYRDNNVPVQSTYIDVASDIFMAVHSQYPCMFIMDSTLKDFDCAILYEYYTKYLGVPNRLDHTIVRRIHVTTLQTYQSSIYIGMDYDHNNKPIVWRRFVEPLDEGTFKPEDIFGDDGESGATNIDIRILTTDTRFVQLRLKQYCYDFQAEILQLGFEYANRTTL